ncbi:hypothetical protein [Streptomyces sp. NPDC017673]|uniref:hypothetical protein n=1 Tax=unclassified Streptomyces TaxID=2593676 RepID=UPI0037AC6313
MTHGDRPPPSTDADSGESAAAQAATPGAAHCPGGVAHRAGALDQALPCREKAADEGDAQATRTLAVVHRAPWDSAEAERWYRTAADLDGGCAPVVAAILGEFPERLDGNRFAGVPARRRGDLEAAGRHFAAIADRDDGGSTVITSHEIREALQRVGHQH